MPALEVFHTRFHKFSTRPFAGDDLHIVCILIGLLRLVQFICLVPWIVHYFSNKLNGLHIWIHGVPYWCPQYEELKRNTTTPIFADDIAFIDAQGDLFLYQVSVYEDREGAYIYGIITAIVYFGINISWLCMVWSAASIGTPTEPDGRDKYLRPLIIFQLIAGVCFPVVLLAVGIHGVRYLREDNFRCGFDVPPPDIPPDEFVHFHFFSILMVTYALEVLFWPTIFVSKITRFLKKHDMFQKREGRRQRYRIECMMGLMLRCLQCMSCGKVGGKDFKNRGELKEFADQFMELLNFDTKLDIVLSDIYVGLHMLARAQLEEREQAIQLTMKKSKFIRNLVVTDKAQAEINDRTEDDDPFPSHPQHKMHRKSSIFVLEQRENSKYQVCERDLLLESNEEDKTTIQNLAHYSIYAQIIYSRLRHFAIENGWILNEEMQFARALETIFESKYSLSGLDCDRAMLCYASFLNGIVSTPYAILVDTSKEKVVITIRGTISIEDMVIDLQYKPARLEKVGSICGTNLDGHCCHKGILARTKWLYNQIKKTKVLKTLYSEKSPFKDFGLVVCGHSLGAGCASLLAIMIRPAFTSVRCFAYEPPGGLLDEELAKKSEDFIISTVRQDDMICRISHQNFDSLRDNFFDILARIKVPKIVAFHDIRTPCSGAIKQRNAKVLRPRADVPTDTDFYKRLKQFRLERAEADYEKLVLPGKIVHFLDPGDGRPHIPYYASRSEFDFIAISKTMASDHSCINLVDVLQNRIRLSGGEEQSITSFATHNSLVLMEEKEEEDADDFRLFMLCLNPYGRFPMILVTCALLAVICSIVSVTQCDFLRYSQTLYVDGQERASANTTMGLFSYRLVECGLVDDGNCTVFVDSPYCVPYSADLMAAQPWLVQAQIFFATLMVFAFISLLLLSISTCYKIGRITWMMISLMLFLNLLFQCLVFTVRNDESLCGTKEEGGLGLLISNCYLSRGAALAITACVFYFLAAVGSMLFAFGKKI